MTGFNTSAMEAGPTWSIKGQEFHFSKPKIMGILNVTPDSFSDGGKYLALDKSLAQAHKMIADGADIIDIGGESTRPGSLPVSAHEELARILPLITKLVAETDTLISVDTQKSQVAQAVLDVGAHIINDISAGRHDAAMYKLVAEKQAGYIMMHMQGIPENMQQAPAYENVIMDITRFFTRNIHNALESGIQHSQIILDPGIGFGKSLNNNLEIMANLGQFQKLDRPLLLGASRKSFIGMIDESSSQKRLGGSLAAVLAGHLQNVQIFRVHDVFETRQTLELFTAIQKHSD